MNTLTAAAPLNLDDTLNTSAEYARSERSDRWATSPRWYRRVPAPLVLLALLLAGSAAVFFISANQLGAWNGRFRELELMFCGALSGVYAFGFCLSIPLVRWTAPHSSGVARALLTFIAAFPAGVAVGASLLGALDALL